MMANRRRVRSLDVLVHEILAGELVVESDPRSPLEHLAFTYADSWLTRPDSFEISPELPLIRGEQRPTMGREMFGSFMDAAPDAWGQRLLQEEARLQAMATGTARSSRTEISRLLLVNDRTRQGALRFRENGTFLSAWGGAANVRDLSALAADARIYEDTGVIDSHNSLLLGAGSSPGGAQPKAWVRDEHGSMLLAKFPKTSDPGNVQLWEMVAIRLQRRAGIRVQPSRLLRLNEYSQIFLTERFDRVGERRIPYMSARTALQLTTYEHASYVKLTREIAMISASPVEDSNEMFSRAALIAMVNNTDDHMRNHGLLRHQGGWRLSPSFDVNPMRSGASDTPLVPDGDVYDRNVLDLLEHLDSFRLTRPAAIKRLRRVNEAVSHWAQEAMALGAEAEEPDSMRLAFEGPNRERVERLGDGANAIMVDLGGGTGTSRGSAADAGTNVWIKPHFRGGRLVPGHFRSRPKRG